MAASQIGPAPAKLSFAKVAAMRAPAPTASIANNPDGRMPRPTDNSMSKPVQNNVVRTPPTSEMRPEPQPKRFEERGEPEYLTNAIEGLSLLKDATASSAGLQSGESGESLGDDQSHLSSSSMKQQSFDTKSMASVTTFAMDEKESIRPDDSASVRAVEEDEASLAPNKEDMSASHPRNSLRPSASGVTIAARRYHTLTLTNPPRFGDLPAPNIQPDINEPPPPSEVSSEQPSDAHERTPSLPVAPDEKLLDALASPKDRLPLLQLEEKFLALIANPASQFFDLPPQNSFARLLAYKLADYYSLLHHINEDGTTIRIFQIVNPIMPTPLHILAQSIPTGPMPPPSGAAFKIMRRAGLVVRQGSAGASTPASSSVPSKATSEAGLEATSEEGIQSPDGTPNKDKSKLTREEREANYKVVRDRIFGDFQEMATSESASTGENSASMSRSSSSSGKRKARKKTPKDDTFEARSAYIPSYTPMNVATMQPQYQPHFADPSYQNGYQTQGTGFGTNVNYGTTPTQAYPGVETSMPYNNAPMGYVPNNGQPFSPADSWSSMQTASANGYYTYPASPSTYLQNMSPTMGRMNNQYMPHSQPGMQQQQQQNWMNNQYQSPYPQSQGQANLGMNGWAGYQPPQPVSSPVPYGYGQNPSQNYGGDPVQSYGAQYPNQSNHSRSLFNPQTRSFVPSNATSRNGGRNNHRKKPSPASSQHQSRNNSITAGSRSFGSETSSTPPPPSTRGFERGPGSNLSTTPQRISAKEDTLQQKYGAPAHLPKKPPPSQVLSSYDVEGVTPGNAGSMESSTAGVHIAAIPVVAGSPSNDNRSGTGLEQVTGPSA